MKKIQLYEPAIHTIPEDTLVFSMVEQGSPEYYKLIMENYVSFTTFYDDVHKETWLRFQNYLNWETIGLFSSFFMPRDIYQPFPDKLSLLRQLLDEGYCLMTFYDQYYISTYGGGHHSHTMAIYGYDDATSTLFCKDYVGSRFTDMEAPYGEYCNSVENYNFSADAQLGFARLGLFGIRINPQWQPPDIMKTKMELEGFLHTNICTKNNMGVGIFKTLLRDLEEASSPEKFDTRHWYEISYFLREGALLMSQRLDYLAEPEETELSAPISSGNTLCQHTQQLYGIAAKMSVKGKFSQDDYHKLHKLLTEIGEGYRKEASEVLNRITTLIERNHAL